MSSAKMIREFWDIEDSEKRKEIIGKYFSYKNTCHHVTGQPHRKTEEITEAVRNGIIQGISFDPGLHKIDLKTYSLIPLPNEQKNVSKLIDRIDLSTILHDELVRNVVKIIPISNLESRILNEEDYVDEILDGSLPFARIVNKKQSKSIHLCNEHAKSYLTPGQVKFLGKIIKTEKKEEALIKKILSFSKAIKFRTDQSTIHTNLPLDKQKILQEAVPEIAEEYRCGDQEWKPRFIERYRDIQGKNYTKYTELLYDEAASLMKVKNKSESTSIKDLYKLMQNISKFIRDYGLPKKSTVSGNFIEYMETSLQRNQDYEKLYEIYDLFHQMGYNGFFFISSDQMRTRPPNINFFKHNPHISGEKCDLLDREDRDESWERMNQIKLKIISSRLNSVTKFLNKVGKTPLDEDEIENIKRKDWWIHSNNKIYSQKKFQKYRETFTGRAFRYFMNYFGGQLIHMRKYFSNEGGNLTNSKNPLKSLVLYLEIQYLVSFFRDYMRTAYNRHDEFKGTGMQQAFSALASIFWKPIEGTAQHFNEKIKKTLSWVQDKCIEGKIDDESLKTIIQDLLMAAENGNVINKAYYLYEGGKNEKSTSKSLIFELLFANSNLQEELYNYHSVMTKLRYFFRTHGYLISTQEVDFTYPQSKLDDLGKSELVSLKSAEISSQKFTGSKKDLYFRTYRTKLHVPKSLRLGSEIDEKTIEKDYQKLEITNLMMRQQVLRFLHDENRNKYNKRRKKKGQKPLQKNFTSFVEMYNLKESSKKYPLYKELLKIYKGCNPVQEIKLVNERIMDLKGNNRKKRPTLDDLSTIPDLDKQNPSSSKISIHDYKRLAAESVRRMAKHTNTVCTEDITKIHDPDDKDKRLLTDRKERKGVINKLKGSDSDSDPKEYKEIAYFAQLAERETPYQYENENAYHYIADALDSTHILKSNFKSAREMLLSSDYELSRFRLIYSCSLPKHFLYSVANRWKTDRQWTENHFIGWRRKVDEYFPKKLKIQNVPNLMIQLSKDILQYLSGDDCKKERNLVRWFQKNDALHLLVTGENLWPAVSHRAKDKFERKHYDKIIEIITTNEISIPSSLRQKITSFETPEICNAAKKLHTFFTDSHSLWTKTTDDLEPVKSEQISKMLECIMEFTKDPVVSQFDYLWMNCIPSPKYTAFIKRVINSQNLPKLLKNKVLDVVFGILAYAYCSDQSNTISKADKVFKKHFTEDNCITMPFHSPKRMEANKLMPLKLYTSNKGVIRLKDPKGLINDSENQLSYEKAKEKWRNNEPIMLGIPLIASDRICNKNSQIIKGGQKGIKHLFFEVYPTKKIVECLRKGANIRSMKILPPEGPSNKLMIDVSLGSPTRTCFQHRNNFIQMWDEEYPDFKKQLDGLRTSSTIGTDFNTMGKFILAVSTPDEHIDLTQRLENWEKVRYRLDTMRKRTIPMLHKKLREGDPSKKKKYKNEMYFLHRKRKNLLKEFKVQAVMILLYIICKLRPQDVGWDALENLTARGVKGDFNAILQYIPKHRELLPMAQEWVEDMKYQKNSKNTYFIPLHTTIHKTNPHTGRYCPKCLKQVIKDKKNLKLAATKKYREDGNPIPYRVFVCRKHKKIGGRDETAAQVCAIMTEKKDEISQLT